LGGTTHPDFRGDFSLADRLLNGIGNGVLRLAGLEPSTGYERVHSVEELRLLVTGMQQAGVVEASEVRIASRAFQFADRSAGELMTPRTEVEAVPASSTLPTLLERARASTHSRWVVYEGSLDNVIGVLHVRRLFEMLGSEPASFDLEAQLQPVLVAPQSKPADNLLDEMRDARQQLALLVDEYGGTAGIVTLQDLIGALVGRIEEEQPFESNALTGPRPSAAPDGSLLLDGLTRLPELEDLIGLRFDEQTHAGVDTLGGLIMLQLGRVPAVGDHVGIGPWRLRVEALDVAERPQSASCIRQVRASRRQRELINELLQSMWSGRAAGRRGSGTSLLWIAVSLHGSRDRAPIRTNSHLRAPRLTGSRYWRGSHGRGGVQCLRFPQSSSTGS
jgi:CBS domain containing-hemolysin-like protein